MKHESLSRTFIVDVEDRPGTLNRVVSLFRRRNYNIDSLTVGSTERPGISRITLVVRADDDIAHRIEANLYKLVNVLRVEDITDARSVVRELAFIKINANHKERGEVLRLCELFRARVVDLHSASMTIEITGPQDKVHRLIEVLRPFGILELLRTGAVAMVRGSPSTSSGQAPSTSSGQADPDPTHEGPMAEDSSDEVAA
jgi:acetolactate synthase-1/3 small subunit